jgi:hypothetical protein
MVVPKTRFVAGKTHFRQRGRGNFCVEAPGSACAGTNLRARQKHRTRGASAQKMSDLSLAAAAEVTRPRSFLQCLYNMELLFVEN